MLCPLCQAPTKVVNSRPDDATVRRRRQCTRCNERFTTLERAEHELATTVTDWLRTLEVAAS